MSVLAHKWVSSGRLSGKAAFADARVCVILHGILGQGRNWMTPAKRIVEAAPHWKCLLVDHRCHGGSPPADGVLLAPGASPRARLDACAADVAATLAAATGAAAPTPSNRAAALLPCGGAPIVIGHSFGGKVALAYAQQRRRNADGLKSAPPVKTWMLDSVPGKRSTHEAPSSPGWVLSALERAASRGRAGGGFVARAEVRAALAAEGLDAPTAAWLAQSVRKHATLEKRLEFGYDLAGVRHMFDAFGACDLWEDCVELAGARSGNGGASLGLVVAGDPHGGMWEGTEDRLSELRRSGDESGAATVVQHMPHAGHNLHVDDLDGLLNIILRDHQDDWNY